ncbi:MAG: type IV pilus assembly protein PilM [Candidatus Omnitrophota bacterium]
MNKLLQNYFKFIKRFIPKKKEGSSVGLDIGINSCKMVEVYREGDSYKILNWAVQPIVGGDYTTTVKTILNQVSMPVENIYTSVYGKGTLIRFIDMPRMSLDDLRNSFSIEADKYFPFTQDQIYTDCYILDPLGKSKQMKVMAAAAKKELVEMRLKMITGLGFETDFIGINPIAIANARSVLDSSSDGKVVAILDMGDSVSNLTVMVGQTPQFNRDIYVGGRDLTKRIANALAVDYEEAEQLKCNPGERLKEIQNACESAISNLIQELRLSLDYFSTENSNEISELILTGGAAMMIGLEDSIAKQLDIEIKRWNPFEMVVVSEKVSKEELNKKSNRLGVALGLALYQYDRN